MYYDCGDKLSCPHSVIKLTPVGKSSNISTTNDLSLLFVGLIPTWAFVITTMMTRALPMIPTTAMMPKVTGTTTEARTGRMLKDVGSKPGHKQGVINITHISFLKHAD